MSAENARALRLIDLTAHRLTQTGRKILGDIVRMGACVGEDWTLSFPDGELGESSMALINDAYRWARAHDMQAVG